MQIKIVNGRSRNIEYQYLDSHLPIRIETISVNINKVGLYPKKFKKILKSLGKDHKKNP